MTPAYRHDPAFYAPGDEIYLRVSRGWHAWGARKGEVVRKTPSGQIIAKLELGEVRINTRGVIPDSQMIVVSKDEAFKLFAEEAKDRLWVAARNAADVAVHVSRQRDINALREAVGKLTSAMKQIAKDSTQ